MSIISRCGACESNQLQTTSPAGCCPLDSSFVLNAVVSPEGITVNRKRYRPEESSVCLKETLSVRVTRSLHGLVDQVGAPATAVDTAFYPRWRLHILPSGRRSGSQRCRHGTSDSLGGPRAWVLPALACTGFLRTPRLARSKCRQSLGLHQACRVQRSRVHTARGCPAGLGGGRRKPWGCVFTAGHPS